MIRSELDNDHGADAPTLSEPGSREADGPASCPRCSGRLMGEGSDGDRACFTCGHVVYATAPLTLPEAGKRRPSHGGWGLA